MLRRIFFLLFFPGLLFSQVVFETVSSSVYDYLNRLSVKGIIIFNDELRPLSRKLIAEKLLEAECSIEELSALEREELHYYKKDFNPEILIIRNSEKSQTVFFENDLIAGFRPFLYRDKDFSISADPVLGFTYRRQYEDNFNHRFNGLRFSGYFYKAGFNFYFRDNAESGNSIDFEKRLTSEPGNNPHKTTPDVIEYNFVEGSISYAWSWGSIDFSKENINWGNGRSGQLIFSDKVPSFPFVRLIVNPVEWLQFQYFHGWLFSGIVDSSSIRTTLVKGRDSYHQFDKFIASHIVSFYPFNNFSFSLGESIVYSHHIEPLYLIPVIFFRLADHYNSDSESNTGDNAQIFANTVYKYYPLKAKIYSTVFIDELSVAGLFDDTNLSSAGITAGINFVDPLFNNSELVFEYTRVDPFVYMNSDDLQLYTSHGYQLGHWIGSNADQFYISYKQWILRGLSVLLWGEYIRKGQTEIPDQQYMVPYPKILYGSRLNLQQAGLEIRYEIFRHLYGRLFYTFSHISDEEEGRIPQFKLGSNSILGFLLSYGF